jgi:type I restriction enzyme M protein
MLDSVTKRRIDTARDILVGKVPDPKSQVEQITVALIYKFMDDMDAEAESLGGKRKFFSGDYSKYGWGNLLSVGLGGHGTLALYSEAIDKIPENPGIPALFRDIFKNAYLPYRDPETLRAFLKVINEFSYDHSERLGDAFEYLLSILGSQGDAGQFRTPRHIIDFVVELMDPQKGDVILDPACGTAGFLISAYKHIQKNNVDKKGNSTLTPDDKGRMVKNFIGYDISPDMVRLSLVNMYLHGFVEPHIYEYDTLTSLDKWNEHADVILANPPFMSPKGGIIPHNRFSVQSKRSEVLFVDYIAEHLSKNGRAGIIVPEGIIFQSQTAYKQLRKMLVDEYLIAVVSLPAGVFNPYSGVKTSILVLDRALARKTDSIAFFKVENDGYGLGAQRKPIDKNDLPEVLHALSAFRQSIVDGTHGELTVAPSIAQIVTKEKISANGDYNLSSDRYRENVKSSTSFPLVPIRKFMKEGVRSLDPRKSPDSTFELWSIPSYDQGRPELSVGIEIGSAKKVVMPGDLLLSRIVPHIRRAWVVEKNRMGLQQIASTEWIVFSHEEVLPEYLRSIVVSDYFHRYFMQTITGVGGSLSRANIAAVGEIRVPLPPLDIQHAIAAEIESYQKVIDGARAVVENYKPRIDVKPEWEMVKLGDVARLINGRAYKQEELLNEGPTPVLRVGNLFSNRGWYYSDLDLDEDKYCNDGDLLYAWSASFGPRIWEGPRAIYHYHIWKIETSDAIDKRFLFHLLESDTHKIKSEGNGIAMMHATKGGMEVREFPLPPLSVQLAIVAEIEAEQSLVNANKQLIQRMENKIEGVLKRVWGEE